MTASRKLQEAVFSKLLTSEDFTNAIGNRDGDNVVDGTPHPYMTIGDRLFRSNNYDLIQGEVHDITLLIWDRDNGAKLNALEIAEYAYLALNEADLDLGNDFAAESVSINSVAAELTNDGVTVLATISMTVEVQRIG